MTPVKVSETPLAGLLLVEPQVFHDGRGFFLESYNERAYAAAGIAERFVMDAHSHSRRGVLRGLHYQCRHPQGKLVWVARGEVYDVAVDLRRGSPTFGRWYGTTLGGGNHHQLYLPPGFAHGFCVLSEEVELCYKLADYYRPDDQGGIAWNDPQLAIPWPLSEPRPAPKDAALPPLAALSEAELPAVRA